MSTEIRFKRGTSDKVGSYTDAKIGEPIYDYEIGRLYVERSDDSLFPVDLNVISSTLPTSSTLDPIGTYYINEDTQIIYKLLSKTPFILEQIHTSNGINFQSKIFNKNIIIPDNTYGISNGPIELHVSASVEFGINSSWIIN